jgi:hypothetical protein
MGSNDELAMRIPPIPSLIPPVAHLLLSLVTGLAALPPSMPYMDNGLKDKGLNNNEPATETGTTALAGATTTAPPGSPTVHG